MLKPQLTLWKQLPPNLNKGAIERAVNHFIEDSEAYKTANKVGFYNQTINTFVASLLHKNPIDIWMAIGEDGEIYGYSIGQVIIDIDQRPTYWVTQGWIHKNYRDGQNLLEGWTKLEEHARINLCNHLVNVTNRHAGAYLRKLGEGWHEYATLLKKDLN